MIALLAKVPRHLNDECFRWAISCPLKQPSRNFEVVMLRFRSLEKCFYLHPNTKLNPGISNVSWSVTDVGITHYTCVQNMRSISKYSPELIFYAKCIRQRYWRIIDKQNDGRWGKLLKNDNFLPELLSSAVDTNQTTDRTFSGHRPEQKAFYHLLSAFLRTAARRRRSYRLTAWKLRAALWHSLPHTLLTFFFVANFRAYVTTDQIKWRNL